MEAKPIRIGSDIAFLGGIVRYILDNERYFREYVVNYTNAASIITEEFRDTEDLDGLFSGWDPKEGNYDIRSWQYEGVEHIVPAAGHKEAAALPGGGGPGRPRRERRLAEKRDETLQHPRCVFQLLKRHFARYTPEMVEEICGVPREQFLRVAETLCANSGRERTSAFAYAVGWTQHSVGVQYIRTASIIQLLLGNMGRPGGGILALRGHASIQGSTDIPTLFDLLPGYMPMPHAAFAPNLERYIEANQSATGWWSEFPKYIVSLLKAWYGDAATRANDYCFNHIPKIIRTCPPSRTWPTASCTATSSWVRIRRSARCTAGCSARVCAT
jgi:formate dehydrogenase major subunit